MNTPITYTPEVAQLVAFAQWMRQPLFGPKPAPSEPTPEQLQSAARLLDLVAPRRAVGAEPEQVMAEINAERQQLDALLSAHGGLPPALLKGAVALALAQAQTELQAVSGPPLDLAERFAELAVRAVLAVSAAWAARAGGSAGLPTAP